MNRRRCAASKWRTCNASNPEVIHLPPEGTEGRSRVLLTPRLHEDGAKRHPPPPSPLDESGAGSQQFVRGM